MYFKLKQAVTFFVAISILGLGFIQPAQATLITTAQVTPAAGQQGRERIAAALARPGILAQLQEFGVGAVDAQARIAALSDTEAAAIADRIDSLPAGGDGIIGALIFVFLVLLVTDILGLTKVYPFTRPIRH